MADIHMTDHQTRITVRRDSHGYPFVGVCACGWHSRGYVAEHAAETMIACHLEEVTA